MNGDTARKIHKALFDATINQKPQYQNKYLLAFAIKLSNKAKKVQATGGLDLAIGLFDLFHKDNSNEKAKKIINHQVQLEAEKEKQGALDDFMEASKENGEYFYLASSHGDCAEDHKPYQGRLYVDRDAPEEAMDYARSRGLYTVQWVMGAPAWFITRPHCRHYFVSLPLEKVKGKSLKKLSRKYHTYTKKGDLDFQTPAKAAIEEYTDRLRMLRALYEIHPTEKLKKEIMKTEMLIKKWKKVL